MKRILAFSLLAAAFCGCLCSKSWMASSTDYTQYVNPFIGCADNGHTFPAATYPFGLVQAGPDTGNGSWQYCSGYRYVDPKIFCFSQTHLNGTGCPDLGDLALQPFTGKVQGDNFGSTYKKETQQAKPGYYTVCLEDFGVQVESTAAPHTALYRMTYRGKGGPARLLVDLQYGIASGDGVRRRVIENEVTWEDKTTLTGHNRTRVWVDRHLYYVVQFDHPYASIEQLPVRKGEKAPRYVLNFDLPEGEPLHVKVALSTVSVSGAKANLKAEVPDWDFDATREQAKKAWNEMLSRVDVLEGTPAQRENLYTALYHLFIQPNQIADVDGQYRGADDQVKTAPNKRYYSTLSLWDTFRAAHPLYTILAPEMVGDFVSTMVAHQKAKGYLPIWTLSGKENHCMIGNHAVPVIVDAYLKGFKGFDPEEAFAAIRESLRVNHPGHPKDRWDLLDKYGYYPFDKIRGESVSRTLECAYDDWCAARLAYALGKAEEGDFFARRSMNYTNVFDTSIGFVRGKDSSGKWREPFDPFMLGHGAGTANDFTEGNAWQYTWHVMQDPEGLIARMGGKEKFAAKLDSLFKQASKVEGKGFVLDVSGLIGQYAHGNEPSHHVTYFYPFVDQPWRTQELVREIFDTQYKNKPDGLCGNDDCGQMSAWYVFSSLGFYPFNPCGAGYVFGAPQIAKMRVRLEKGRSLTVTAKDLSEKNLYVQSITLNGVPMKGFQITHDQIRAGGDLVFTMGPKPVRP